jgi:hypothetical protein
VFSEPVQDERVRELERTIGTTPPEQQQVGSVERSLLLTAIGRRIYQADASDFSSV